VVECIRDHVRLLDDLPNGTALAQEIVVSLVLPITKILTVENDKLHNTFVHVAFSSQRLLKPSSDQIGSDTNSRTREGDQRGGDEDINTSATIIPSVEIVGPITRSRAQLLNY
jgi:hypothetical protein